MGTSSLRHFLLVPRENPRLASGQKSLAAFGRSQVGWMVAIEYIVSRLFSEKKRRRGKSVRIASRGNSKRRSDRSPCGCFGKWRLFGVAVPTCGQRLRVPTNCRTLIKQSVLGFELLMDNVKEAPITIHPRLPPGGSSLLHLHTPMDRKDRAEDVETPSGQRHFVDL